jgi:exopolyphosphatase/guanosine-5'-triphosphate,3'-diphosphate pyrophosphatase
MDESRNQRIQDFKCRIEPHRVVLTVRGVEDISLEQLALKQNGGLFEEVFGSQVLLKISRQR